MRAWLVLYVAEPLTRIADGNIIHSADRSDFADDAEFACTVGREIGDGKDASRRGEIYHVPLPVFDHGRQEGLACPEHGSQIDVECPLYGLVLKVKELKGAPAPLRVMALQSESDWQEGKNVQDKATREEVCFAWARFGVDKWLDKTGKEVPDLRAALYDRKAQKPLVLENSTVVTVKPDDTTVTIPLDAAIINDLGTNEKNRGLVLFTAQDTNGPQALLDFQSRENRGGAAVIVLEVED